MSAELERVRALIEIGRFSDALEMANRAAASEPDDRWPHLLRSICLLHLDDAAAALDAAHRSLAAAPDFGRAHHLRSKALQELKAPPDEVVNAAMWAVEYEPDTDYIWFQMVCALLMAERFEDAEFYAARMREQFPSSVETEVAAALIERHRPSIIDRFLAQLEHPVLRIVVIGMAIFAGGLAVYLVVYAAMKVSGARAASRAEAAVRRALEVEPDSIRLHELLADLHEDQGRYVSALDLRVRSTSIEPQQDLVDASLRTIRRGLAVLVVAIGGATISVVSAVVGNVDLRQLNPALGATLLVVTAIVAVAGFEWGATKWLARVPKAVARRVVDDYRSPVVVTMGILVAVSVAWAVFAPRGVPVDVRATTRWAAGLSAVVLATALARWFVHGPFTTSKR